RAAPQTHTHGDNDRNKVLGGPTGNHVIINFYYVRLIGCKMLPPLPRVTGQVKVIDNGGPGDTTEVY
ncbi:MAG: hypothetical protein RXN86_04120, partial [Vulcanisaeta sp.]